MLGRSQSGRRRTQSFRPRKNQYPSMMLTKNTKETLVMDDRRRIQKLGSSTCRQKWRRLTNARYDLNQPCHILLLVVNFSCNTLKNMYFIPHFIYMQVQLSQQESSQEPLGSDHRQTHLTTVLGTQRIHNVCVALGSTFPIRYHFQNPQMTKHRRKGSRDEIYKEKLELVVQKRLVDVNEDQMQEVIGRILAQQSGELQPLHLSHVFIPHQESILCASTNLLEDGRGEPLPVDNIYVSLITHKSPYCIQHNCCTVSKSIFIAFYACAHKVLTHHNIYAM